MNNHCPTRRTNPFATCWIRPGAIPFQFPPGQSADQIVAHLSVTGWCGEIVGPHGSGKTTLLETLKPLLTAAGRTISAVILRDGQRRLPQDWLRRALASPRPMIIIDGYEQLSRFSRMRLKWHCGRAHAGLLVTSHSATGLPPILHLRPDWTLVEQLVSTLTRQISSRVTTADVAASHACHGSNVRELLFALYERHEQQTRAVRTA